MVKLSLKGAQDPTDSSLQMKVPLTITPDPSVPRDGPQAAH